MTKHAPAATDGTDPGILLERREELRAVDELLDAARAGRGHLLLVEGLVDTDDEGYVITEGRSTRTKRPGVFASGDLVDHTYRQAVTAAGSGTQAALDAEWYLRDTPGIPPPEGMPTGDLAEAQWAPVAKPG